MNRKRIWLGVVFFATMLTLTFPASAYTYFHFCNSQPSRINGSRSVLKNTLSFPAGSTAEGDLVGAVSEWNTTVMSSTPASIAGTSSSPIIVHGDTVWEVGLASRADIGGNNGLASVFWGPCNLTHNAEVIEVDITVANDLFFGNPDESAWDFATGGPLSARDVMMHEWGHLLGLDHQAGYDVMISGGLKPRVGGTGSHSTPAGDDRLGAANLYGNPSSFRNLAASAQRFSGGAVTTTTFAGTQNVSPTTVVNVAFTAANHGTQNLGFSWRVHINTCASCTTGGITWRNFTGAIANNRNQVTTTYFDNAPVSQMACNTYYWTFHTVDSGGAHAETREFDNTVHHALTLFKPC